MDPDYISSISGGHLGPDVEEIRSVDGGIYHRVTNPDGTVTMHEIQRPYEYSNPILAGDYDRHIWRTNPLTATTRRLVIK